MPRHKNSTHGVHFWLEKNAYDALRLECKRLSIRPGQFLSRLITERSDTFYSNPVQLLSKK
jgi:hypothetical protein